MTTVQANSERAKRKGKEAEARLAAREALERSRLGVADERYAHLCDHGNIASMCWLCPFDISCWIEF
jgi:hypothetical protein